MFWSPIAFFGLKMADMGRLSGSRSSNCPSIFLAFRPWFVSRGRLSSCWQVLHGQVTKMSKPCHTQAKKRIWHMLTTFEVGRPFPGPVPLQEGPFMELWDGLQMPGLGKSEGVRILFSFFLLKAKTWRLKRLQKRLQSSKVVQLAGVGGMSKVLFLLVPGTRIELVQRLSSEGF